MRVVKGQVWINLLLYLRMQTDSAFQLISDCKYVCQSSQYYFLKMRIVLNSASPISNPGLFTKLKPLYEAHLEPLIPPITIKSALLTVGFFFAATFVRWWFKAYIKDDFENTKENIRHICKFCQIERETQIQEPNYVLYQDEKVVVFKDIRPASKYHILVVSREHIKNCKTLPVTQESIELVEHMEEITKLVLNRITANDEKIDPKTYRIGFHRSFGTSQDHLHMHGFAGEFRSWYKKNVSYNPNFIIFISTQAMLEYLRKNLH